MPDALTPAAALGADEFADLLKKFSPLPPRLAVAVSGGPDSIALAFCLKRWGQRDMVALIVDHALRRESAAEAQQTQNALRDIGVGAEILRWDHAPVTNGLHEKARQARYALLNEACRRLNSRVLFTAHHRDDQAETILLRLAKGSGIEGLSGIAESGERDGILLLRPFLDIHKQRLIATCQSAGLGFVQDSSNDSPRFARGRLRSIMPLLEKEGMTTDNLLRLGHRAREADQALKYYANLLLSATMFEIGGNLRISRGLLRAAPRAVALGALSSLLRAVHDSGYPPEYDGLGDLLDFLLAAPHAASRTYYNCIASVGSEDIIFMREPAAATAILPLPPGGEVVWDRRWRVSAAPDAPACDIRALGNPPHDILDRAAPFLRHAIPQGRIRASLPGLWQGASLYAVPDLAGKGPFRMRPVKQSFP